MAREILFKAKRLDNGKWLEGYLYIRKDGVYEIDFYDKVSNIEKCTYEVDSETLCQYTGLTDKNGNKIWENDIIQYHFGEDKAAIKYGEYQSCFDSQKTCHVGFYVDWKERSLRKDLGYWVKMIDCNIVGNIFDNSELLEVQ